MLCAVSGLFAFLVGVELAGALCVFCGNREVETKCEMAVLWCNCVIRQEAENMLTDQSESVTLTG